uniref:Uncharacterized protein n=1 Tax=Arion vulgaris TaxID=1028688 RepID=A0A0B6ZWV1_9EUPU
MATMDLLRLLLVTYTFVTVSAQVCPPLSIVIVVDMSETSKAAATQTKNFDLLHDVLNYIFNNTAIANPLSNVSAAVYGYSSSSNETIVPEWSTARVALSRVNTAGSTIASAGSTTSLGLSLVKSPPPNSNNRLVLISTQGTTSANRTAMSVTEANRLRSMGFNLTIFGLQGANAVNLQDLAAINNGVIPKLIIDTNPTPGPSPKGFRGLIAEFDNIIRSLGCSNVPATTPMSTTRATVTTGPCSQCLYDGGFTRMPDPDYCDSFYWCSETGTATRSACADGTFFDGNICNEMSIVKCPSAECTMNTPVNTYYPSGRCCNVYYECTGGKNVKRLCANGEVYNHAKRSCEVPADIEAVCRQIGKFECDKKSDVISSCICSSDTFGNQCYFWCWGYRFQVSTGTVWSDKECSLIHSTVDYCQATNITTDRDLDVTCKAAFSASYNGQSRQVMDERSNAPIDISSIVQNVILSNDAVVFAAGATDPFLYYFYFNNNDIGLNFAINLRFKFKGTDLNINYDLLSNNYCKECPATISFTIAAKSSTTRSLSATLVTTGGTIFLGVDINMSDNSNFLEVIVVFDDSTVSGLVKELNQGTLAVITTVRFPVINKTSGSTIMPNKCGFVLGRGHNNNFVGDVDNFAVYRNCKTISSLLN